MAAGNGAAPIPAPLAAPPRVGLMGAVIRPEPVDGWLNGITFDPEAVDLTLTIDGYWWDTCTPDVTNPASVVDGPGTKTEGARPERVHFIPWQAVEADTCSTGGWRTNDYTGRARRKLTASLPAKVEHEFWTGQVAQVGTLPNQYLASLDAEVLNAGALTPLPYALGDLQEYLAETITGRGLIHCTPATANLWLSAGLIRREGTVWLDVKDNIVVPGDGYPGTSPEGEAPAARSAWAYATGSVYYLEDGDRVIPDALGEALDRSTNLVTFRAERTVLPFWDTIGHAGVLVDHCTTCCEATS